MVSGGFDGRWIAVDWFGWPTGQVFTFYGLDALNDGDTMTLRLTKRGAGGWGTSITSELVPHE